MGSFLTSWIIRICDSWLVCQISALKHGYKCVKNPPSSKSYLEDVDGSWLDTWRMGSSWHHGSSWYAILDLCAKFQLSSMNRSVSVKSYLEDTEGSWPETWRMGSSLTCWMILGDPQELILKVLWRSDFIWLRYWLLEANWDTHTDRQTDRHTDRLTW